MRSSRRTLAFALFLAAAGRAAEPAELSQHLAPLAPLVGKTWRGVFPLKAGEKTVVDVQRFEEALNGQAVRSLHSINDGEYGGESLFVWDEDTQSIVYFYFTTAGFRTNGTMKADNGALVSRETVKGKAGGTTEVRATSRLLPDGRLHVKTEHLKDGQWVPGRDMHYVESKDAVVRFKD